MPYLLKQDVELHYETNPPGEFKNSTRQAIVLVNGHTRTLSDFRGMARYFADAGFFVVSLDNRGSGKTTSTNDFAVSTMARDIVDLLDCLQIPEADLLGISMGGIIVQTFAVEYPNRLRKLILVSTSAERKYLKNNESGWIRGSEGVSAKMASYFTPAFIERNKLLFDSMVKQISGLIDSTDFIGRAEAQRLAVVNHSPPVIERISAPTLVVHGSDDQIVDVEGASDLARRVPGAKITIFPGAGHLLLAEKPKELYAVVLDFILGK